MYRKHSIDAKYKSSLTLRTLLDVTVIYVVRSLKGDVGDFGLITEVGNVQYFYLHKQDRILIYKIVD